MLPIRICRHCKASLGLNDTKCRKCGKKTLDPNKFKLALVVMSFLTLLVFSFLFYGIFAYREAATNLSCNHDFYTRADVSEVSCDPVCDNACAQKNAGYGIGIVLSEGYSSDSNNIRVSCQCTCQKCI